MRSAVLSPILLLLAAGSGLAGAPAGAGTLEVAVRPASVFVFAEGDTYGGFDMELLRMFSSWRSARGEGEASIETRSVTTVPELLEAVRAGGVDLGLGAITITEERDRTVDFSIPYLPVRTVLVARTGAFDEGTTESELAGRRIGAIAGSTNAARAEELAERVAGLEAVTSFPTNEALFEALVGPSPRLDAAVTDITHFWDLARHEDVALVMTLGPPEGLGFVFPEASPLKAEVDAFLRELRRTNTYFNLIKRYFGSEAAEMVKAARE